MVLDRKKMCKYLLASGLSTQPSPNLEGRFDGCIVLEANKVPRTQGGDRHRMDRICEHTFEIPEMLRAKQSPLH